MKRPYSIVTRRPPPVCGLWALFFAILAALFPVEATTQTSTSPPEGLRQNTPKVHAFTNAKIVVAPGVTIEKGTMVIRDGVIEAIGSSITTPPDAKISDMSGKTIYPGLIETYSSLGMPTKKETRPAPEGTQAETTPGPGSLNPNVRPERNASEMFKPDPKAAESLRVLGFTDAVTAPPDGIFRGTSALVHLGDGEPNTVVLEPRIAQHLSFEGIGDNTYPNSMMGAIALIRQTFLDAHWYREAWAAWNRDAAQERPEMNQSLEALEPAARGKQPVVIPVEDDLALLRAAKVAQEFGFQLWVRGSGYEYRRIDAIKAMGVPVILPANFPDAPSVDTPEQALQVSLEELRHWDMAPDNPKKLQQSGIPFTLTTSMLKDKELNKFHANVRKAIERGLTEDQALAALTTTPAKLLGIEKKLGTLGVGKLGHFIVTDGPLFSEKSKILEVWIDSKKYEVKPKPEVDPRGEWRLQLSTVVDTAQLNLTGEVEKLQGTISALGKKVDLKTVSFELRRIGLVFRGDSLGQPGVLRLSADVTETNMSGSGELPDGKSFLWWATRIAPTKPDTVVKRPKPSAALYEIVYPEGSYGLTATPEQPEFVLVKNATIWTQGPQGKLEKADMLIRSGKIAQVGVDLRAPQGAVTIDASGKHLIPGMIDAHSHSAISQSVNEGTQAVTAEVRIGDVIDSDDIYIYRQLAGGLTAANLLHGSANPIGGQNAVIKLRWSALPDQMKLAGAPPGIKFALGENVKQSNWGDRYTTRYPQTRMGVEQLIRDEFKAAQDYRRAWQSYQEKKKKNPNLIPPRRDLELDTIVEILEGKRLVHSHSYRQDEILMLMRVAEDFGFRIATFQHVLEGYKVADIMATHGAGASCFSDWWAYKFEVYDAIPYNGALMHEAGVVVSFNSDSGELARRMNLEAAKAVKYGGVSEEEALNFVTLNPAKQLRIDKWVGSLEPGKDADFSVWSGHPLSTYSICEQTWVDGRKYFDLQQDASMRERIARERAALIQKVYETKEKPADEKAVPSGQ